MEKIASLSEARRWYQGYDNTLRKLALSMYSLEELVGKEEYKKIQAKVEAKRESQYDAYNEFWKNRDKYDM